MDAMQLPQALFTLEDLGSMGGLVLAVYIIVSFFKDILKQKLGDWAIRPFSVLIAVLMMAWLIVVNQTFTVEAIGLAIVNAFLVALVAGAAHDFVVAGTSKGKKGS